MKAQKIRECYLHSHFKIVESSYIPTRKMAIITNEPLIWRYFAEPLPEKLQETGFENITTQKFMMGIIVLYRGVKP